MDVIAVQIAAQVLGEGVQVDAGHPRIAHDPVGHAVVGLGVG
jgi:hypothetical protein